MFINATRRLNKLFFEVSVINVDSGVWAIFLVKHRLFVIYTERREEGKEDQGKENGMAKWLKHKLSFWMCEEYPS